MKVFVSRDIPQTGIDMLRSAGMEVEVWMNDDPITQLELIDKVQDVDALLCMHADRINLDFLTKCKHLKVISQFSVGYDNMDVEAATKLGIPLGNAPNAMTDATADTAFLLMLAASRKMCYMHKTILSGDWKYFKPKGNLGMELKHKTLGIFGLGTIGLEMARRCYHAYEMEIIYCNRGINKTAKDELNAEKVSFDQLLERSDILSVHSVLSDETRGKFDRSAFLKMKKSAIFINTSRGLLHNEMDLIEALQQGEIWGAGLDVTNPEPMKPDNPLLFMENVVITPHIGSATMEARDEMSRLAALNIIEFAKGNSVPNLINRELE